MRKSLLQPKKEEEGGRENSQTRWNSKRCIAYIPRELIYLLGPKTTGSNCQLQADQCGTKYLPLVKGKQLAMTIEFDNDMNGIGNWRISNIIHIIKIQLNSVRMRRKFWGWKFPRKYYIYEGNGNEAWLCADPKWKLSKQFALFKAIGQSCSSRSYGNSWQPIAKCCQKVVASREYNGPPRGIDLPFLALHCLALAGCTNRWPKGETIRNATKNVGK